MIITATVVIVWPDGTPVNQVSFDQGPSLRPIQGGLVHVEPIFAESGLYNTKLSPEMALKAALCRDPWLDINEVPEAVSTGHGNDAVWTQIKLWWIGLVPDDIELEERDLRS